MVGTGQIWIREIIRNKDGKVIDTVCDMDGIRSHMDPQSLVAINERRPGTVPNLAEMFVDQDSDAKERIDEWTGTKKVGVSGTSMTVAITEACRILGLERGDVVEVTIRRKR